MVRPLALYAVLIALSAVILLPLSWMLTAALKPDTAPVFTYPPEWFPTRYWHWQTFRDALTNPDQPFVRYALNSTFISLMNVIGSVISCSMIAYAFARLRFRGRDRLFVVVIATMLMPAAVLLIPQFLIFYRLGWYGTYLPLIVPSFTGNAFFIFLLRQFFMTVPRELSEAARVDGAGELTIFSRVILPLAKPALFTVGLFQFLNSWGDLLGPLIYLTDVNKYTVSVGLTFFRGQYTTAFGALMAASTVMLLPVLLLFFFTQRTFIQGITLTGIKG